MTFTTHPTWHEKFFDEIVNLSDNMFRHISWFTGGNKYNLPNMTVEFYLDRCYIRLAFYDHQFTARLFIYGDIWHYEYSDPNFTPKTIFDTIKRRHQAAHPEQKKCE